MQWDFSMPSTQPAEELPCGYLSYTLFGFVVLMDYLTTAVACIAARGGLVLGWDQLSTLFDVSAKDSGGSRLRGA